MKRLEKNKLTKLSIVLVGFLFYSTFTQGQNLPIFVQHNRYTDSLSQKKSINSYYFIGHAYIDPQNEGIINYDLLKKEVLKRFPNQDQTGYLVLDVENSIYHALYTKSKTKRKRAVNEFVRMINFVKKMRPELKVSVYGIPLRFNYSFQKEKNHLEDLLPLLKTMDFLSPDLYFSFAESQQSKVDYLKILKSNLALYSEYSRLSGTPLLPFIWYKIDPYNKKYGGQSISKHRLNLLLWTIKQYYRKNGTNIIGTLWWESWNSIRKSTPSKLSNNVKLYLSNSQKQ